MTKLLDKICKLRDILTRKDKYEKIVFYHGLMKEVADEIHRQVKKKLYSVQKSHNNKNKSSCNNNYELDFTAQDLRELSSDIRGLLKRWESIMSPEKNIKSMFKKEIINFDEYWEKLVPIMNIREQNILNLTKLLNTVEYHSILLYVTEVYANDEFALKYTERLN